MTTTFTFETDGDTSASVAATEADDGEVAYISDHATQATNLLIDYFRTKPRWAEICQDLVSPIQTFEDLVYEWYTVCRDVENATGDALNKLGSIVREPRADRTDGEYRRVIAARILVNRSTGKIPELYAVADALTNAQPCSIVESYPASMVVYFYSGVGTARGSDVTRMLRQAKAGGVRLETVIASATSLRWASSTGTPTGAFAWGSSTGTPVGGTWASAV